MMAVATFPQIQIQGCSPSCFRQIYQNIIHILKYLRALYQCSLIHVYGAESNHHLLPLVETTSADGFMEEYTK